MDARLKPMLCGKTDKVPDRLDWVLEGKLDGWRLIAHRPDTGPLGIYARSGASYANQLPWIERALLDALPPDTAVDGEIIGGEWGDVQGVMTRGARDERESLTYVIFDITRFGGTDVRAMPWTDRRKLVDRVTPGGCVIASPVGEATQAAHEQMLRLGLEGSVVKRRDSRYVNGRSNLWLKIKPQQTAEAKVVGFKPGTAGSAFDGLVGALELEMLDTGCRTRASGFDMDLRRQITAHPEQWLGQIVEIKHHGIGKEGAPRHPQFHRRRDDRAAPARPTTRRKPKVSQPKMRNYGAMKPEKLLRCIAELEAGVGDAVHRAASTAFSVDAHRAEAVRAAEKKGLR